MINFPALKPTSRSVTQGQFAVKRFTSVSGAGRTRIYGSQPFNSLLEMSFDNIADNLALLIVNCYENARGSYDQLSIPNSVWNGMEEGLRIRLQRDYVWRFSEQPQLSSTAPGKTSVTVKLEGQRDG